MIKIKGYSLLELVIALFISSILVLGISSAFSSIAGLIRSNKNVENAQEVLRYTNEVFTRSLKKFSNKTIDPDETDPEPFDGLTVTSDTLSITQRMDTIACNGQLISESAEYYTETYSVETSTNGYGNSLKCSIDDGSTVTSQTILTGIESIEFELNDTVGAEEYIVKIFVQPFDFTKQGGGVGVTQKRQIDIALSELIMNIAVGAE